MENNNQNIIDQEDSKAISILQSFIDCSKENASWHKIIKTGLESFNKIDYISYSSLFLLNEETLLFEHENTVPNSFKDIALNIFNEFLTSNTIGDAINNNGLYFEQREKDKIIEDYIIIPLHFKRTVKAILILSLHSNCVELAKSQLSTIELASHIYKQAIENKLINMNLKLAQTLLEQRVAYKTLSLSQSMHELQTILNSVQTGIFVVNPENNQITNANLIALEIIDDQYDNIIDKPITDYIQFDNDIFENVISNSIRNVETKLKRSDGINIPILVSLSYIQLGDHNIRIDSFLDITDIKRIETELKLTNEILEYKVQERTEDLKLLVSKLENEIDEREKAELEVRNMLEKEKELSELKSRFVSMVSHEFRTPLTIISSSAQIVKAYKDKLTDNELNGYFDKMLKTVDSLSNLLENVIFIGKTDAKMFSKEITQINIIDYCSDLVNDILLSQRFKRVINFTFDGITENITLDEKLLQHIILNLLSNALKYSDVSKPVDFNINISSKEIELKIKDYGIGIPSDEQDKIFDQFYRAKNVGAISGTGLGMTVLLRSLDIIGGKISLQSQENIGTTFFVIIPIRQEETR